MITSPRERDFARARTAESVALPAGTMTQRWRGFPIPFTIPAIVPAHEVPAAIGLSNVAAQLMFPLVLPLAGYLNDRLPPGEVVLCSLVAWTVSIPALSRMRSSSVDAGHPKSGILDEIRDGLAYVGGAPAVRGVLLTVIVVHVVGMPGVGALGPVWMRDILGLSASQIVEALLADVASFTGGLPISDDVILMVVRRRA